MQKSSVIRKVNFFLGAIKYILAFSPPEGGVPLDLYSAHSSFIYCRSLSSLFFPHSLTHTTDTTYYYPSSPFSFRVFECQQTAPRCNNNNHNSNGLMPSISMSLIPLSRYILLSSSFDHCRYTELFNMLVDGVK